MRTSFAAQCQLRVCPLTVWAEIDDRTWHLAETEHYQLRPWRELTEGMKAYLAWFMSQSVGGYSFDANLESALEARWKGEGADVGKLIQKRIRRHARIGGLADLPYFYAIEGRTASGKTRTHLHVHGFFATEDALDAPRFKIILEKAICSDKLTRTRRQRGVHIKRLFLAPGTDNPYLRHASYVLKNIDRFDDRVPERRVFMSHTMTELTRSFYEMVLENAF